MDQCTKSRTTEVKASSAYSVESFTRGVGVGVGVGVAGVVGSVGGVGIAKSAGVGVGIANSVGVGVDIVDVVDVVDVVAGVVVAGAGGSSGIIDASKLFPPPHISIKPAISQNSTSSIPHTLHLTNFCHSSAAEPSEGEP